MSPRDRNGEFEPKLIPKYQRDISGIEEKVISLYARGMSARDIHDQLKDLYGIELSAEMVSKITDKILPQVKEWQSRPLAPIYPFVFMDCIHYKVREDVTESRPSLIPSAFKGLPENPSLIPEAGRGQSPQKATLWMSFF